MSWAMRSQVAQASGGAYDPTAGPLVDLWGFGPGRSLRRRLASSRRTPMPLHRARARCGWQRVSLDREGIALRQPGGVQLDLSAPSPRDTRWTTSRGTCEARGIESCLVEVGGELRGAGVKPDGQPWWVALETAGRRDARTRASRPDTLVALHGLAIATSGDYRRCFPSRGPRASPTPSIRAPAGPSTHDARLGDGAAPRMHGGRCAVDGPDRARPRRRAWPLPNERGWPRAS